MNKRVAALLFVFLAFSVLSEVAVWQHGYLAIFEVGLRDTAGAQVFADLTISITLVAGWMWLDAQRRNATVLPYLLAIPFLGSFGPLAYLIVREWGASTSPEGVPAIAA